MGRQCWQSKSQARFDKDLDKPILTRLFGENHMDLRSQPRVSSRRSDESRLEDEKGGGGSLLPRHHWWDCWGDSVPSDRWIDRLCYQDRVIKDAISYALRKGLDIFSDLRSTLQKFYSLVPRHRAVLVIRDLFKNNDSLSNHCPMNNWWIKFHIGYAYNEHIDTLGKKSATRSIIVVQINLSCRQTKNRFFRRALIEWQNRWDHSENNRVRYAIFQIVSTWRHLRDTELSL